MNSAPKPQTAVYLAIAESAWSTYLAEIAEQPAHQWFLRCRDETYPDAMAVGYSGSLEQWGKEMRAAGDRIQSRRVANAQARRTVQR